MPTVSFESWPCYTAEEANAVTEVLLSNRVNYWTGDECRQFETEFAAWTDTPHAVGVANGTVALEFALRAVGVGPGDEVVVSPRTFVASASAIVNVGAVPVFADISPDSQNITASTIEGAIGPRTRAIVCVHLAGWPCDMDPIQALAAKHDLRVIEDCAQAHGARYKGRSVGGLGDVGAWSFCQDKIMTTGGEGGMVTTRDETVWSRVWSYKDHGKSFAAVYQRDHTPGFRWLHESFGTNGRMTEIQSVIGRIQLTKMAEWHAARARNAAVIREAARACPALRVPDLPENIEHGWYKCYVFVRPEQLKPGWDRNRIMGEINRRGVPCFSGACSEIYLEKAFDGTGWRPEPRLPVAKELGSTSLMFLVHPTLSEAALGRTTEILGEVMAQASDG